MKPITSLLNRSFAHTRPTRAHNGAGGWLVSEEDLGELAGRLRPASASEITVAAQRQARITHVLYCAGDADVRRGDILSDGDDVVTVVAVRETSAPGHHLECDCEEVQREGARETGS